MTKLVMCGPVIEFVCLSVCHSRVEDDQVFSRLEDEGGRPGQ